MKVILQRVLKSSVEVEGQIVGSSQNGFCILAGISPNDTEQIITKMAEKIVNLRVFEDENGKMNRSLIDIQGSALIVSQFTLLADCSHGRRPSFTNAGNPEKAKELFDLFVEKVKNLGIPVETGVFGTDMLVTIYNSGPATFILESE